MGEFGFNCPAQLLDRHMQAIQRVNQMRSGSGQPLLGFLVRNAEADTSGLPGQCASTDNVWVGLEVAGGYHSREEETLALGAITLEVMMISREVEAGVDNKLWRGPLSGLQELQVEP